MNYKEKRDILRHIKLGIDEVFYYDYNGQSLPLRSISSYEMDDCFYKSLKYSTKQTVEFIIKLRLKLIDDKEEVDIPPEEFLSLQKHYDTISYWVVYYSMKDFQNEDFSKHILDDDGDFIPQGILTIRNMNYVHNIASFILDTSFKPKEILQEIIKDDEGLEIGYVVHYLNQPLNKIGNLTKLQRDYLVHSKGEILRLERSKPRKKYIVSGEKMTMEDLLKSFGVNTAKYAER